MTGSDSYKIGRLDIIEISVYGVPELSVTAKVGDDGNLQLPLLGQTPAAGKTAEQLQQELTARLGADYLQNPQVSVLVKEFNSRYVILTGAIRNGVIPLKGETTLLELIAGSGGFSEASDSTVLILREKGGKRLAARFDVAAIEKGKAEDVVLQSGDRIVAGTSTIKKIYGGFMKALPIAGVFGLL
jgi:polysaccharide export outer membrane protein